jgi:hypothetical protein
MTSRLSFGFWAATLAPRYKTAIWANRLSAAFPHATGNITQDNIYGKVNRALDLRNRIFHHEPLLGMNLSGQYSDLMALQKWICPHTQAWVKAHCSMALLLRSRPISHLVEVDRA